MTLTFVLFRAIRVAAFLLQLLGGLALLCLLVDGVYTLFATSVALGLMFIGGSVVGGWVLTIITGLLYAASNGILLAGASLSKSDPNR